MAKVVYIKGVKEVLLNIRKFKPLMGNNIARGLKRAGLYLQRESQKIVPVEFGNLKNSAFTRAEGTGWNTVVLVGYTMFYAVYVHENLEARHAPGKTAKYLETPLREKQREILHIIAAEA